MGKATVAVLVAVLAFTMGLAALYNSENVTLKEQIKGYQQELTILKTANLTTALGIKEIPPDSDTAYWGNKYNHLWVTGYIYNCGGSIALQAGLRVVAKSEDNSTLMNMTVPLVNGGVFSADTDLSLLPAYLSPSFVEYGDVLSKENVTVRFSIYHEGSFSNSSTYDITPFWTNPP